MIEIPLKTTVNARDLGNTPTLDGKTIKPYCFIRTASLHKISDEDVEILTKDFKLKTDIDLRIDKELKSKPDREMPGVTLVHCQLREDVTEGMKKAKGQSLTDFLKTFTTMPQMYINMVSKENSLAALKQIFEIIFAVKPGEAVLFHCSEGKDRTGIVAALILKLLNVDDAIIFEDYLKSNLAFEKRNRRASKAMKFFFKDETVVKNMNDMYEAQEFMLKDALTLIETRDGSVEKFFTDRLGFDPDVIKAFKERVTE